MAFFVILNLLAAGKIIWLYRIAVNRWGWFKDDHLKVPKWIGVAMAFASLFIPYTPLMLEGMVAGFLVFFGNEWVYQKTGWSPLADTAAWVSQKFT